MRIHSRWSGATYSCCDNSGSGFRPKMVVVAMMAELVNQQVNIAFTTSSSLSESAMRRAAFKFRYAKHLYKGFRMRYKLTEDVCLEVE